MPTGNGTTDRRLRVLAICSSATPSGNGTGTVLSNLLQQFSRREMSVVCSYWLGGPRITWSNRWPRRLFGMFRVLGGRGERWIRLLQCPLLFLVSLLAAVIGQYHVLLVVYPVDEFLLIGYLVSVLTRRPLLPYFLNTYLDSSPKHGPTRWLQPRIFRRAGQILVISEGMKRLFAKRYPDLPCHVLTHSHNIPIPDPESHSARPIHDPVRLVMIGNINATNLDATTRIFQAIGRRPNFTLTAFTTQSAGELARLGLDQDLMHVRTVPYETLLQQIQEHDIVLHPHGITAAISNAELRTIFPTRTIEYLLSCRPILAHVPADSAIGEFYHQRECALVVSQPDPDAICSALDQLLSDDALRSTLVRNALRTAAMFRADRVSQILRTLLQKTARQTNSEGTPA